MTRAMKVCGVPGCAALTTGSRCAEHAPEPWAGSTRASRLPSDWRKRRARILRRDPVCRLCHVAPSVEVDHIAAGRDDHRDSALQGVCRSCHAAKSQREAAAARAARRQDGER